MKNLISKHATSQYIRWLGLIWVLIGFFIGTYDSLTGSVVLVERFIIMLVFFAPAAWFTGLPFLPVRRLEIYEEGLIYRTLWAKQTWKWSDVSSIKFRFHRSHLSTILQLKSKKGAFVTLRALRDWTQLSKHILNHIEPNIYQGLTQWLERSGTVKVNDWLQINRNGLLHHGHQIEWRDIDDVRIEDGYVVIGSQQFNNPNNQIMFDQYQTENGGVYARLAFELWEAARRPAQRTESTHILTESK